MLKTLQKQQDTNAWKTNKTFLILFQVWGNWTCRNSTTPFHGWFEASSLTMSSFLDVSTHSPHSLCHYVIFGYRSSSPSLSSSSSSQSSLFSVSRLTWTHIIIVIPILIVILIIIIIILTIIIILIIFRSQVDVDAALVEAERVGRACSRQFPSCSVSRIDILRQLYDLDAVFCSLLVGVVVVVIVIVVLILVFLWLRVKDRNSQAILGSCQHETYTFVPQGLQGSEGHLLQHAHAIWTVGNSIKRIKIKSSVYRNSNNKI